MNLKKMENNIEKLERLVKDQKDTINKLESRRDEIQFMIDAGEDYLLSLEEDLRNEIRKRDGSTIPKERWGVHETHCCSKHGCKYGQDNDCPVALGLIKQKYDCQNGYDMDEDCFSEDIDIQTVNDNYKSILEQIEVLTKNSSSGEIFKIHELVKGVLK